MDQKVSDNRWRVWPLTPRYVSLFAALDGTYTMSRDTNNFLQDGV